MITKFEKITEIEKDGNLDRDVKIVDEKDATHIHKCYHDEVPFKPCTRRKL